MGMKQVTDEHIDSYSNLFFVCDNKGTSVSFSSLPMEEFFEFTVNLQKSFPFLPGEQHSNDAHNSIQDLEKTWRHCLQLQEKEAAHFSFTTDPVDKQPKLFRFDAVGINPSVYDGNSHVLFSVKKSPAKKKPPSAPKTRDINQKDYAEFIEIAAHDLDAPLRKISLLVDRISHAGAGADLQGYFARIQSSLTEMRALIDNLTTWASLSPQSNRSTQCDTTMIINESLADLRLRNPEKIIEARVSAIPRLEGDPAQYRLLFRNLLKNAVTYSVQSQPVIIDIMAESLTPNEQKELSLEQDKQFTRIVVKDNGIGFDQQYAEKIFRPFASLQGKSEYPGTGMGLAICKKIVDNHGGLIYGESIEKNGASFTLILPQCHL